MPSARRGRLLRVAALLVACAGGFCFACPKTLAARVPEARPTTTLRGVGLGLFATDPNYDYGPLLDEIVQVGATDVLIVVAWYQHDVGAHQIAPRRGYSPSRGTVQRTLLQAKKRGLRTSLLPIVRLVKRTRTQWRGKIRPRAGPAAWFDSYGRYLDEMAEAAAGADIDRLGVGSELLSMERYADAWRALIARVRARFSGRLYYSANWDHFDPIQFWDALDEVAVTAYFELAPDERPPSDAALRRAWRGPKRQLAALAARVNKPLVISEIGYPSKRTAARYPWDETRKAPIDLALQTQLYRAFCDSFSDARILSGFFVWNWFGFGGPDDGGYTPRQKPAARALSACLARPWPAPRGRPVPSAPGAPMPPSDVPPDE